MADTGHYHTENKIVECFSKELLGTKKDMTDSKMNLRILVVHKNMKYLENVNIA